MFKRNTKGSIKKDSLKMPQQSRVAFIQLNDGVRIGQARQKAHNVNLLQSRYGMTPEEAKRLADDIEEVFLSGTSSSR